MAQFCLRRVHGKWGTLQPQCCTPRRMRWWQQGTPTGRREAQGLQGMQYAMFIQDKRKLKSFWKYSSYPAAILNYGMSFWTRFYMYRSREALYSRPGAAEDKNCAIMWAIVISDGQNAWSSSIMIVIKNSKAQYASSHDHFKSAIAWYCALSSNSHWSQFTNIRV